MFGRPGAVEFRSSAPKRSFAGGSEESLLPKMSSSEVLLLRRGGSEPEGNAVLLGSSGAAPGVPPSVGGSDPNGGRAAGTLLDRSLCKSAEVILGRSDTEPKGGGSGMDVASNCSAASPI